LREQWADVKTPWGPEGSRRTYTVGTIEVRQANLGSSFSGAPAEQSGNLPGVNIPGTTNRRQVVMLQCVKDDQAIVWQRYFYGAHPLPASTRAANARAVAVWPALAAADTRVAICGEVFDEELPLAKYQGGPTAMPSQPSGFIAVYDGSGELLWTHHLFVPNSPHRAAVTDLSIRREVVAPGITNDVVTYCGITTHGTPSTGTLAPVRAFGNATSGESDGATDVGAGQWDGFVGRVECDGLAVNGAVPVVRFHSTLGATGQNGLFGLAELSMDRFVVVGSTSLGGAVRHPGTSSSNVTGQVTAGVVAVFDAAPTRQNPAQNLQLEGVRPVGDVNARQPNASNETHLRDVAVGINAATTFPNSQLSPRHMLYVVGSTNNDMAVLSSLGGSVDPTNVIGPPLGGADGLILTMADVNDAPPDFRLAAYVGTGRNDGLTGVSSWSEYGELFTLTGWTGARVSNAAVVDGDILLQSWFNDRAVEIYPPVPVPLTETITRLHSATIGGANGGATTGAVAYSGGHDRPCGMGLRNATSAAAGGSGGNWDTYGLGDPAGGGVAVDARARATVAGVTWSFDFPVTAAGPGQLAGRSVDVASGNPLVPDAVRSTMDLLPVGVGRTDGSGDLLPSVPPQFQGGTTPVCGLAPFGIQIGGPGPGVLRDDLRYPPLLRIMLDYQGPAPDGISPLAGASVVMVRPPSVPVPNPSGGSTWKPSILAAALRLGLPQSTMVAPEMLEIWTLPDPLALASTFDPNQPIRQRIVPAGLGPMVALPPGYDLTVQLVCLVAVPVPSGTCASNQFTTIIASPAIWVDN
jgi:hypothetical protein